VEVATQEVAYRGEKTEVGYRLDERARQATLRIVDARGQVVRQFDLDAGSAYGSVEWDGQSDSDRKVPKGVYLVVVEAEGPGGVPVAADALKRVRVEAVRYTDQEARLWADGQELSLGDLRGVLDQRR
jgi:flagellar hook assembly protein FlgD